MPFEPLRTDEKLETPARLERDMDTQMLFGCSSFVVVSLATYGLIVWPYFVWQRIERGELLGLCLGVGLGPALLLGAVAARKQGLAGGFGFLGGVVACAIFLYLRLQSAQIAGLADQAPMPEWPSAFVTLLPAAAVCAAAIILVAFVSKTEFPDADKPSP